MICSTPTKKYPQGRTGTVAGHRAHIQAKETPCDECKAANRRYSRAIYQREKANPSPKLSKFAPPGMACMKPSSRHPQGKTGTEAGEAAHRRAKEPVCHECQAARNEKTKERRRESRPWLTVNPDDYALACEVPTAIFPSGRRGTYAGYQAHLRGDQTQCEECLGAGRSYNREKTNNSYDRYREKKLAYQAKYRAENREKIRLRDRAYYLANMAEREARKRAREIRLKELPSEEFTVEDIRLKHGIECYLCLGEVDLTLEPGWSKSPHLDHVHPISDEGTPGHVLSNVRWTHARCNLIKGAKMVQELTLPLSQPELERYGDMERI